MAGNSQYLTVGNCTVAIGSDLGYVKDGATITPTVELFTIDGIEQLLTASRAWRTNEAFECAFTLCEPTQANINIALDNDNTWTGVDPKVLDIGDNQFPITERVLAVTGYTAAATQYTRTVTFHKAVLSTPAPIKFTKGEETNLACVFRCLIDEAQTPDRVGQISDAES